MMTIPEFTGRDRDKILRALGRAGYRTPHEVLAAATGVVASAMCSMSTEDRATLLRLLTNLGTPPERAA